VILKGSQRGGGADLAIHLMNKFDNESIEIAELHGAIAGDLYGAFSEFESVARGTKAKEYLYSLSINPRAPLTREQYFEAIQEIEHGLGLTDQPRAVVFHIKDGREHCHVVWSRIDVETMRAIHLSYDHSRLMDLSCKLARKFGLELTNGQKDWEAKQRAEKASLEPNLAENAQEQATGISAEERQSEITALYNQSDSAEAFRSALEAAGYIVAAGDRRGLVIVDEFTNVHSLTRYIKGHKAKDKKAKLAPLLQAPLPSVDAAKDAAMRRRQAREEREREQDRADADKQRDQDDLRYEALCAARWAVVRQAEQELFTLQQAERMALHAAQHAESKGILFRVRAGVADLLSRSPGLRSVLLHLQRFTHLDPRERHRLENEALARRHARELRDIERQKRFLSRIETRERLSRERALRRAMEEGRKSAQAETLDTSGELEEGNEWRRRLSERGDLTRMFNDESDFEEGDDSGDDGDGLEPGEDPGPGDDGEDGNTPKFQRRKGRGYRR